MANTTTTLVSAASGEALKLSPVAGSLIFYGMTAQQWTIVFGCLYAAGLLLDLVVRRWLVPLGRFMLERRARRAESEAQR